MLKIILFLVLALVLITGAAGGFHLYRVKVRNTREMEQYSGDDVVMNRNLGRVLVVYYSLSGRTRDIAERIKAKTGADIYEIKTAEEIKAGPALYLKSKSDLKKGSYPELQGTIPDMGGYDVVFVGSPIWWYTAATPVMAFLEKVDFKGRKVVPFSTQGSNAGTFLKDFERMAVNANLTGYQSFNNIGKEYDRAVNNKISAWLNSLTP
ncbi:MAG: NAD(P)H-dependent oxidoreductase [Treponema sp.]|jgi:flavodoxin|nr:NAD(P)H-dependent oxidoreductase [Treponema sp.]